MAEAKPQNGADIPEEKKEQANEEFISIPSDEFKKLEDELAEYRDKYLRLLADTDNMRKRMQKEKQELIQYAVENNILLFLQPIDQLENALLFTEKSSEEVKNWALGFQMILKQFKDVLQNNGVVSFTSLGLPFDPHTHEAIEMIESKEHPHGVVIEEHMRGYKMGDRVIRPARVKVAKTPEKGDSANSKNENK